MHALRAVRVVKMMLRPFWLLLVLAFRVVWRVCNLVFGVIGMLMVLCGALLIGPFLDWLNRKNETERKRDPRIVKGQGSEAWDWPSEKDAHKMVVDRCTQPGWGSLGEPYE